MPYLTPSPYLGEWQQQDRHFLLTIVAMALDENGVQILEF